MLLYGDTPTMKLFQLNDGNTNRIQSLMNAKNDLAPPLQSKPAHTRMASSASHMRRWAMFSTCNSRSHSVWNTTTMQSGRIRHDDVMNERSTQPNWETCIRQWHQPHRHNSWAAQCATRVEQNLMQNVNTRQKTIHNSNELDRRTGFYRIQLHTVRITCHVLVEVSDTSNSTSRSHVLITNWITFHSDTERKHGAEDVKCPPLDTSPLLFGNIFGFDCVIFSAVKTESISTNNIDCAYNNMIAMDERGSLELRSVHLTRTIDNLLQLHCDP